VLHFIGMHGESYATNQSMNGLLNRLLFNGNNLIWNEAAFAPFNSIVYAGTVLSFLALVGLSLFFPWGQNRKSGEDDFACCVLVATMASPVAWEHHYGILFPIFIWLYFGKWAGQAPRPKVILILLAYILTSDNIELFDGLASVPVLNIFQSYLFLGALLILTLLLQSPEEPSHSPRTLHSTGKL
jgi:alpha-1,2-mannosyltransferase